MADDDILTVAQVAAQFHVTPQTVRSWIDSGKLKGGRVGKAYVILRATCTRWSSRAASERQHGERAAWADERESELPPASGRVEWAGRGRWAGAGTATRARPATLTAERCGSGAAALASLGFRQQSAGAILALDLNGERASGLGE